MSWALVIHVSGSSLSVLLFVVMVAVLGAGLSFVDASSLFVGGGARLRAVYVLQGWRADVCGCRICVGVVVGHQCVGWLLFCCGVVLVCHCVTWPVHLGVRGG